MTNGQTNLETNGMINARGFSLVEITITALLLTMLLYMVTVMVMAGSDSSDYAKRLNRVVEISQEIMDDVQSELGSAVRTFGNDSTGVAYRNLLEAWPQAPAMATSKLPAIQIAGTFSKDSVGNEKTGNELLFARAAWSDAYVCGTGTSYRVDVYRIVRYFVKVEGAGAQPGSASGFNLCKWVSEPMVDGNQIDGIADTGDRTEMLLHLLSGSPDAKGVTHPQVEVVWKMGDDPAITKTLRHIQADGSLADTPQSPRPGPWSILRDPTLGSAGELAYRWHSVASNYSQSNQGVCRFAILNNSGDGFPQGLEVQVIGPRAARQVLVHLTIVSNNNKGQRAYFDLQTISDIREG